MAEEPRIHAPSGALPQKLHWTDRLRDSLPRREVIVSHPWLKPFAYRLLDPKLWRLQHESVARGIAIGTFWAFAIPVAQVFIATAHCIWWRGNVLAAASITLITNPLTIGFWLWLAYQCGSTLLGTTAPIVAGQGTLAWLASLGGPTLLGMGLFAIGGSLASYALVKLAWRARILILRRNR